MNPFRMELAELHRDLARSRSLSMLALSAQKIEGALVMVAEREGRQQGRQITASVNTENLKRHSRKYQPPAFHAAAQEGILEFPTTSLPHLTVFKGSRLHRLWKIRSHTTIACAFQTRSSPDLGVHPLNLLTEEIACLKNPCGRTREEEIQNLLMNVFSWKRSRACRGRPSRGRDLHALSAPCWKALLAPICS